MTASIPILIYFGIVLSLVALGVRFAGNRPVLAGSRNAAVKDMKQLNRWAGNRLLLLPLLAFALHYLTEGNASARAVAALAVLLALFGVIGWIAAGSRKFLQQ